MSHVLVVNAGSSSLKYSLVDPETGVAAGSGLVERIGESEGDFRHTGPDGETKQHLPIPTHEVALELALGAFGPLSDIAISAVGHRVVHGGELFSQPALVTEALLATVESLVPLAPLHNPANIEGMKVALKAFPEVPHVAVFDTAFHHTLPDHVYTYALPHAFAVENGIRRYGFHGTSVAFVSRAAADFLSLPVEQANLIVLHLGNGASATAVAGGRSVETSMGMTPLEGLVMGTRSGDIDPALHAHLHRQLGWSIEEIDRVLNRDSGLKGLIGHGDVRELVRLRNEGDHQARLAFDVYCHRIRKYVGAYYAVLGRVDAIVFTGGVGENSADVRAAVLDGLDRLGIGVDATLNTAPAREVRSVSSPGTEVAVLVVPTNEEWEIARSAIGFA